MNDTAPQPNETPKVAEADEPVPAGDAERADGVAIAPAAQRHGESVVIVRG